MGNNNGITSAMLSSGTNNTIDFKDGYFSFAFGNEIAFCVNGKYYILNCSQGLWEKVQKKVKQTKSKACLSKWWKKQSANYEISGWSGDFTKLK